MPTLSLLNATHFNTLQHAATTLQHYCNTDDIGANANEGPVTGATSDSIRFTLQLTATHCNNTATTRQQYCNTDDIGANANRGPTTGATSHGIRL